MGSGKFSTEVGRRIWLRFAPDEIRAIERDRYLRVVFAAVAAGDRRALRVRSAARLAHCGVRTLERHAVLALHVDLRALLDHFFGSEAARLLGETSGKVSGIAWDVGHSSTRSFQRVFLLRFQVTPREFRRLARAGGPLPAFRASSPQSAPRSAPC